MNALVDCQTLQLPQGPVRAERYEQQQGIQQARLKTDELNWEWIA